MFFFFLAENQNQKYSLIKNLPNLFNNQHSNKNLVVYKHLNYIPFK